MASYLKNITVLPLSAPQLTALRTFVQACGLTAGQAANLASIAVTKNLAGVLSARMVLQVDGATDKDVLDDVATGGFSSLISR